MKTSRRISIILGLTLFTLGAVVPGYSLEDNHKSNEISLSKNDVNVGVSENFNKKVFVNNLTIDKEKLVEDTDLFTIINPDAFVNSHPLYVMSASKSLNEKSVIEFQRDDGSIARFNATNEKTDVTNDGEYHFSIVTDKRGIWRVYSLNGQRIKNDKLTFMSYDDIEDFDYLNNKEFREEKKRQQMKEKNITLTRISGVDRYATSANIASILIDQMPERKNIAIASGEKFPDALSAGLLSCHLKSPLLLVKQNSIPNKILLKVKRINDLNYIAIVGGENSISKNVENEISKYSKKIYRVSGKDRYSTSHASNAALAPLLYDFDPIEPDVYAVYNGNNFPDALSAVPFMYSHYNATEDKLGLLATNGENNSSLIQLVFGGENSVKKYKEKNRIAGEDRYKTAVEVAKAYKTMLNMDIDTVVITSGEDYPDALCAGPLASNKKAAILLTNSKKLNVDTKEYIKSNPNIKNIIIVGGENSVSKDVEKELLNIRQ